MLLLTIFFICEVYSVVTSKEYISAWHKLRGKCKFHYCFAASCFIEYSPGVNGLALFFDLVKALILPSLHTAYIIRHEHPGDIMESDSGRMLFQCHLIEMVHNH